MKCAQLFHSQFFLTALFSAAGFIYSSCQHVTQTVDEDFQTELPKNLILDNSIPQTYEFSLHWKNRDVDGNEISNTIATAQYTRGLPDGYVKWDSVQITELKDTQSVTTAVPELNGMSYQIIGDNFMKQDFYNSFPQERLDLIRWLVADAACIEIYGWMYFDSLTLNEVFSPALFKNLTSGFEGYVNFTNQGLSLCWTGISERNGERCAVIRYQAMYNPLNSDTDVMTMSGRSMYWGDVWVSLADKQIEYATINEDVVFTVTFKANNFEQRLDLQREIIFKKIN